MCGKIGHKQQQQAETLLGATDASSPTLDATRPCGTAEQEQPPLPVAFLFQDIQDTCAILSPCFCPPVLAVPFPALLAPSGHPCLGAVFPGRANFNGGVLQGSGPQGDLIATLRTEKGSVGMLHSSTTEQPAACA